MQPEMALAERLYGSLIAPYGQPGIEGENTTLAETAASFNLPDAQVLSKSL